MNSPLIKEFIQQQSNLFWHIPEGKKKEVSQEVLVETILNYGDINAVKQLLFLLGIDEVAKTFYSITNKSTRKKSNLHELTVNYFTLFFDKYAHRNI
jgi:hypothetical protein